MIKEKFFVYENLKLRKIDSVYPTQFGWHRYDEGANTNSSVKQNYILHVVLNGEGIYKVKKQTFKVKKGQAFLIKPSEVVYYYPLDNDAEVKFEYVWLGLDGYDMENVLTKIHLNDYNAYILNLNDVSKLKEIIFNMIESNSESTYYLTAQTYLFLDELDLQTESTNLNIKNKQKHNNKIIEYINKNIKDVSVQGLCDEFNLERTSLYKLFKREFSMSPQEYILKNKLEIARELIVETNVDLKTVCINSGFVNYSHFSRIFSEKFGCSPINYRKKNSV